MEEKTNFSATYFDRDSILRLARLADVFAWGVLAFALFQTLSTVGVFLLQLARRLLVFNGVTDVLQQVVWFFQPIPQALVYFIALQAVGKALLIFMDVEDNLRRIARNK